MEYVLEHLRSSGASDVVLCTGHLGHVVEQYFGTGKRLGMRLRYSREPMPRGTAGALKLAEPMLEGERWLVLNGDSFFAINLQLLWEEHTRSAALATLALARVADARRYGSVEIGPGQQIRSFLEKQAVRGPALVNGGVYVIERALLRLIEPDRAVSLEHEIFPEIVGEQLHGLPANGLFVDIGMPDDYLRVRNRPNLLRSFVRPS